MRDIIVNIFGTYTPISYELDGVEVVADGFAGVDWPYVLGVVLFGIVLYSVLRIIGVFLKK